MKLVVLWRRAVPAVVLVVALPLLLIACGAAPRSMAPESAGAAPAPAQMPSNGIEGAEVDLERAEVDLERALGGNRQYAQAPAHAGQPSRKEKDGQLALGNAAPPPASPSTAPAPGSESKAGRAAADDREVPASELATAAPCAIACRALASMERAVEHLCELAGPEDARCENARARARSAAERVHGGCPAC